MASPGGGTFFGLIVKPNKRYDTTVKETFRVGKACLDPTSAGDKITTLFVEHDTEEYIIANLDKKNLNENLDLAFSMGEKISFKVEGPGTVHLTGNILKDEPDLMDEDMMEEESEEEEEEIPMLTTKKMMKDLKRKQAEMNLASKKMNLASKKMNLASKKMKLNGKTEDSSDDDSDDDSDDETLWGDLEKDSNDDDDDEGDDDDEEEDSDDDADEEMVITEEKKQAVVNGKTPEAPKPANGAVKKSPRKKDKKAEAPKTPKVKAAVDVKTPKKNKKEKTPKKETTKPEGAKTPEQEAKADKKEAKTPKKAKTPLKDGKAAAAAVAAAAATPKSVKKTVKGGIQIEDLKEGTGPECKVGQQVGMFYSGRLKTNNKQFDSCLTGKPFKFRLGKGEVIKGWDVGVVGLKVGGKRRLTIPPSMGYGAAGAPPDIPANSTLVFDVECKYVN